MFTSPSSWNSNSFYIQTTGTTATTSGTYVLQPVQAVNAPPKAEPESELAWLRRRVQEVTDLVAA